MMRIMKWQFKEFFTSVLRNEDFGDIPDVFKYITHVKVSKTCVIKKLKALIFTGYLNHMRYTQESLGKQERLW